MFVVSEGVLPRGDWRRVVATRELLNTARIGVIALDQQPATVWGELQTLIFGHQGMIKGASKT